jgi:hypothetical protein
MPNPSFEARPNGKPPGPAPGKVYHPSPGLALYRRSRLNSNVRQRKSMSLEMRRTPAETIASSSLSCNRRGEHGGTQSASEDFTRTASGLTSFGVRGSHGWLASAAKTAWLRNLVPIQTGNGTRVLSRTQATRHHSFQLPFAHQRSSRGRGGNPWRQRK